MESRTIKYFLNQAVQTLEEASIEDAKQNVYLIASKALNISYAQLPLHWQKPVYNSFLNDFNSMINRRLAHEPLQYILGKWCFLDFEVNVGEGVLIPRPETEEVFLAAVEAIKKNISKKDFNYADIGTGTGILGLAMAKYFPKAIGYLVDISEEALKVAKSNLLKYSELLGQSNEVNYGCSHRHCETAIHNVITSQLKAGVVTWQSKNLNDLNNSRLSLIKSDLLEAFTVESLDVIISNPPYIDSKEVLNLMPEVVKYEPHLALDGGEKGLCLINKLQIQASEKLKNQGLFIFEHGHGQREAIKELLLPCWKILKEGNDFANNERFFILQLNKG